MYEFLCDNGVPHVAFGKLIVAHDEERFTSSRRCCSAEPPRRRGARIVGRAFIVRASRRYRPSSPSGRRKRHRHAEEFVKALLRTGVDEGSSSFPGRARGADRHAEGIVLTRTRIDPRARRRQRRRSYADDVSRMSRRDIHIFLPRRYASSCGEASAGERARLPAATRVRPRPRRHLVRTTGGQVWLGPTIGIRIGNDYESDASRWRRSPVARRLIDGVTVDDLRLSGSGIRAKLHPPSESFADFYLPRPENPRSCRHQASIHQG